jgi:hypothetical protein
MCSGERLGWCSPTVGGCPWVTGGYWVLWVLSGLSVLSIAVMIDRARAFWAQRDDLPKLVSDLDRLLRTGRSCGGGAAAGKVT